MLALVTEVQISTMTSAKGTMNCTGVLSMPVAIKRDGEFYNSVGHLATIFCHNARLCIFLYHNLSIIFVLVSIPLKNIKLACKIN